MDRQAGLMNVGQGSVTRTASLAAGVMLWGASLLGATQLHMLDLPIGHGICGPWGCAAEPEALLGYHAFWGALLIPLVALVCRVHAGPAGRRLALAAGVAGLLGIAAIFLHGAMTWARAEGPRYAVQRGLFDVATTPDLPVLPLALAGAVGVFVARPSRVTGARTVDPTAAGYEN